jgi:hypothetical protein
VETREVQNHEGNPSRWCWEGHVARDQRFVDSQIVKSRGRSECTRQELAKSEFAKKRSGPSIEECRGLLI